jgi:isopentenyl-diphosphate Delta-isomerase
MNGSRDLIEVVDERGVTIGAAPKADVHQAPGILHRAVSLCIIDPDRSLLVQRRSLEKSLFRGIWSNSVCTHVSPGSTPEQAVCERVHGELGIVDVPEVRACGTFTYEAFDGDSGFVEREVDHVFMWSVARRPQLSLVPTEVSDAVWMPIDGDTWPGPTTPWFAQVVDLARRALDAAR